MADLTWEDLDLNSLFPTDLANAISTVESTLDTVISTLEPIVDIIALLAALVEDYNDPLAALLESLITEVENLINDTLNANVYVLYQKLPTELGLFGYKDGQDATKGRSANQTVEEMVQSLFDLGDPNRPIVSDSGSVGGVMIMAGAPSASQFNSLITNLNKLFGIKDWDDWLERQERRFEVLPPGPGTITAKEAGDDSPPTGLLIDGRQSIDNVPENVYIRIGNGGARNQVFRVISAVSGGAELLPESEQLPGVDGVTYTIDPVPFGVQQNNANFAEILNNIRVDAGGSSDPIDQVDVYEELRNEPFYVFNAIDANAVNGDEYSIEVGTFDSIDPDWSRLPLTKAFVALGPLFDAFDVLLDVLVAAKQGSDAITELTELIQAKLDAYADIVTQLNDIVADITAALAATGFHVLFIPEEVGGINQFIDSVRRADNLPEFGPGDYTVAVTFIAAGPDLTALLGLFS